MSLENKLNLIITCVFTDLYHDYVSENIMAGYIRDRYEDSQ